MSRIHEALKRAEKERATWPAPSADQGSESLEREAGALTLAPKNGRSLPTDNHENAGFSEFWNGCLQANWQLDPGQNIFTNQTAPHAATEQLRRLRSRLYQIREKQALKTILITSAVPAEGKTFIASNLAQAIARQEEQRVLLIDADLRCSRLHSSLRAPLTPGLSEYLRGQAQETAIIQKGLPEYLCLIPAGAAVPNPTELIANGKLKSLVDNTGSLFDWVVIDSPPALPVSDSAILAGYCDAVLLVVRSGFTPYESAQRAAQEFRQRNLIGVVLNRVDYDASYPGYDYQYYGYGETVKNTPHSNRLP